MKKLLIIISIIMSLSLMLVPATMALTISTGEYVQIKSFNSLDNAGIFTFNVSQDGGATTIGTYDTFCIQENVYIYPNTWYEIALSNTVGLDSTHVAGEGALNGAVDYLFYRYTTGAYNPQFASPSQQADFQNLLWYLQGEISYTPVSGTPWATDLANYDISSNGLQHPWGTEVINIYTSTYDASGKEIRTDIQNQLYNQVPEPSTLLFLGVGLLGLGFAIRWRKS